MEKLNEWDKILEELEKGTNKEKQVERLQEIGSLLLTEYELRINNIVIEPLRVEPYYYKDNIFEDKFIHWVWKDNTRFYGPRQRNRFGKLYIHNGYSGVDIVLSRCDSYAFSFLIKNSRVIIDGQTSYPFVKQYGLAGVLKSNGIPIDYDIPVLCKKDKANKSVVFRTIRNGLTTIAARDDFSKEQQEEYNRLQISSFIELKEHTSSEFDFSTGYGGDRAVVEYLKDYKKVHPDISLSELDKLRKDLYPNGSKTLFTKEFGK